MEIDINGSKYCKREKQPMSKKQTKILGLIAPYIAMSGLMGGSKTSLPSGIDIVSEYRLIKQKSSSLSRKQRDEVVFRFEKEYVLVDSI